MGKGKGQGKKACANVAFQEVDFGFEEAVPSLSLCKP